MPNVASPRKIRRLAVGQPCEQPCMRTPLPERHCPCFTPSRSRGFTKLHYRQVSPTFQIAHDERRSRSPPASDRRLWGGTGSGGRPVLSRLESPSGVGRPKTRPDVQRGPSAERVVSEGGSAFEFSDTAGSQIPLSSAHAGVRRRHKRAGIALPPGAAVPAPNNLAPRS